MYWLLFGLSLILLYYLLLTICCLNNFIKIIVTLKLLKRKNSQNKNKMGSTKQVDRKRVKLISRTVPKKNSYTS